MKIGVQTFVTDETMSPDEIAQELEDRGFDALFLPEHPHVPVSRATPYPNAYGGGDLPEFYKRPFDPFVSASLATARTSSLLVGTGICLLAFRDAVITAKAVASIDRLSSGRFVFGVGFGWNEDEFATHGQDFRARFDVVAEKVAAMREIWRNDVAKFYGSHVQIAPSWCWPKPSTPGGPPVWVGGAGPRSLRAAATWGDAWYPTPPQSDPALRQAIPRFRQAVADVGRDPDTVGVCVAAAPPDEELLDSYQELGVQYVSLRLYARPRDEALRDLDKFAAVRDKAAA